MFRRFIRDINANMSIMFAVAISIGLIVSTFAVDAGSLYYERRYMQSTVDLAAITAAKDISRANLIAQQTLVEAQLLKPGRTDGLVVTPGNYNPSLTIEKRFTPNLQPFNAVDVRFSKTGTLYFGQGLFDPPNLEVSGTAALIPEASFSVGSRLLSLNGGLANALLGPMLGLNLTLKVGDYTALIDTKVELLSFLEALAQEMDLTVGTYDQLLEMDAKTGVLVDALEAIAPPTVKTILSGVNTIGPEVTVPLNKLFSVGNVGKMAIGDASSVTGLKLSMLEILGAAAAVSNGKRAVDLNVGANVPSLSSLTTYLGIGEPPNGGAWFRLGPAGTILRTAQARLYLDAEFLGGLGLLGANVRLPIWIELASGQAQLISMSCPSPGSPNGSAVVDATPGLVRVGMGEMTLNQFSDHKVRPIAKWVRILSAIGLSVDGYIDLEVAKNTPKRLTFTSADIGSGAIKTANTRQIVGSLGTAILKGLEMKVNIPILSLLVPGVIEGLIKVLIMPLAGTLDLLIDGLLSLLGINVGEVDVRVYGVRCSLPALIR